MGRPPRAWATARPRSSRTTAAIWQGRRLCDGEELARHGVAAFASARPSRDPATIAVQIGHRGHSITDGHAAHVMARGNDDAGKVEAKNEGGGSPHEIEVRELVLKWVER